MIYIVDVILMAVINLREVRRAADVTQVQLAAALDTTQGQISRLERQSDLLLSTLGGYLSALGASARLVVTVNGQTFEHELTGGQQ